MFIVKVMLVLGFITFSCLLGIVLGYVESIIYKEDREEDK